MARRFASAVQIKGVLVRRIVSFVTVMLLGAGTLLARADGFGINFGALITGEIVPGVYGQVVLGNAPPPPLIYSHPVMIAPVPYGAPVPPPLYLYVPPFQMQAWGRYCFQYRACQRPVYFVNSPEYAPGFDLGRWRREHPEWEHERAWERPAYRRGWGGPQGYRGGPRGRGPGDRWAGRGRGRGPGGRWGRDSRRGRGHGDHRDGGHHGH